MFSEIKKIKRNSEPLRLGFARLIVSCIKKKQRASETEHVAVTG